jgi:hypothetical protein
MVAAIETRFNGCLFRSRLEARWSIFFESAGIGWDYEPTFIEVKGPRPPLRWLPDFRLDDNRWVEVKGTMTDQDAIRYISLAYFVGGSGHRPDGNDVVFLGPLPEPADDFWPITLHRCRDGVLWAVPFTLEPGCPLKDSPPRLVSAELTAAILLAGVPWGQPDWAEEPLSRAKRHRFTRS